MDQGFYGDIESMGSVKRKNHLIDAGHMKEGSRLLPTGEGSIGGSHSRPMSSPSRAGQVVNGVCGGASHRGRLLQGGGRAVQIDHSSTS